MLLEPRFNGLVILLLLHTILGVKVATLLTKTVILLDIKVLVVLPSCQLATK